MPTTTRLPTVTAANYYTRAINEAYMSVSQFKSFRQCEARAMAETHGDYIRPMSIAMLVGSYVDAYFSGEMEDFQRQHADMSTKAGRLKAPFIQAEKIIARAKQDKLFSMVIAGKAQEIRTGYIAGVPFKIKIDSLLDFEQCTDIVEAFPKCLPYMGFAPGAIVDYKVMQSFEPRWVAGLGRVSFIEAWGYDLQMAVYREIEGHDLPCFIAGLTKEDATDMELFAMQEDILAERLMLVEELAPRYQAIKASKIEPERCGRCDYCRTTKVLDGPVDYTTYGFEGDTDE